MKSLFQNNKEFLKGVLILEKAILSKNEVGDLCVRGATTPFSGLFHFTLDSYLIMQSIKQGGIKYYFFGFWYDSTWDWTPVSRSTGENCTQ